MVIARRIQREDELAAAPDKGRRRELPAQRIVTDIEPHGDIAAIRQRGQRRVGLRRRNAGVERHLYARRGACERERAGLNIAGIGCGIVPGHHQIAAIAGEIGYRLNACSIVDHDLAAHSAVGRNDLQDDVLRSGNSLCIGYGDAPVRQPENFERLSKGAVAIGGDGNDAAGRRAIGLKPLQADRVAGRHPGHGELTIRKGRYRRSGTQERRRANLSLGADRLAEAIEALQADNSGCRVCIGVGDDIITIAEHGDIRLQLRTRCDGVDLPFAAPELCHGNAPCVQGLGLAEFGRSLIRWSRPGTIPDRSPRVPDSLSRVLSTIRSVCCLCDAREDC